MVMNARKTLMSNHKYLYHVPYLYPIHLICLVSVKFGGNLIKSHYTTTSIEW